jgi:carbonic anhydrase
MPNQRSTCRPRLCVAAVALLAWTAGALRTNAGGAPSYAAHGTDWRMGQCSQRDRQSPISIDRQLKFPPSQEFEFWYNEIKDEELEMKANGGLLSLDLSAKLRGGVAYNNKWYPLARIDFHAKSEHRLKGKQYPLEIQLVHREQADPTSSLIISVLVWSEVDPEPPNPRLKPKKFKVPSKKDMDWHSNIQNFVTAELPSEEGKTVKLDMKGGLDLSSLVANPKVNGSDIYMSYAGSLTSPPCLGNAQWFVRRISAVASSAQVKALSDAIHKLTFNSGNNRAVMPVNGRILQVFRAVKKIKMKVNEDTSLNWGSNPRTDGEYKAQELAKYAEITGQRSAQYIGDFAKRLQGAQEAYANELMKTTTAVPFEDTPEGSAAGYAAQVFKVRQAIMGTVASVDASVNAHMAWQTHQLKSERLAWETYNMHQQGVAENALKIEQANAAIAAQQAAAAAAAAAAMQNYVPVPYMPMAPAPAPAPAPPPGLFPPGSPCAQMAAQLAAMR